MPCPWCNYANNSSATYCGGCGRTLEFQSVCPACSSPNPSGYVFCDACGSRLAAESQVTVPAQEAAREPEAAPLDLDLSWVGVRSWIIQNKREVLLVASLIIVAAFLRIYRLGDFPPGLHGDEAWTGIEARRILEDGPIGVWSPSALGQPAGTFYWTAFLFSFLEPSLFTLRLSAALLGVLTVLAFYVFARAVLGPTAASVGAVLLTVSFWHIHYSRIAFPLVALPFLECVALVFLVQGLRTGRLFFVAIAGATSALGVYVYGGFVAFALTLALFWAFLVFRRAYPPRRLVKYGLAFLLPAFLVGLPFLNTLVSSPSDVLSYGAVSSTFSDHEFKDAEDLGDKTSFVLRRLRRGFSLYFTGGQMDYTDGMGARGLLDLLTFGLFVVGAAAAVWRWREWGRFLLLAGLVGGVLVTAYMALPSWAESRRGIGALPMVFALAGLGGDVAVRAVSRWMRRRWAYALVGSVVVIAAYLNLNYYFGTLSRAPETRWVFVEEFTRASKYLGELPDTDLYVYFYSGRWSYNYETRRFLLPDLPGEDRSHEFGQFTLERDESRPNVVYVLLPPYQEVLEELRALYPGGRHHELKDGDRFIFSAYHLEGGG